MKIEATLSFETPVSIGSGAQVSTFADRAMLKNAYGWPYVPASALKGRLRHALEQVLSSQGKRVCRTVIAERLCRAAPCPVCDLLGSPWLESKLLFENLDLAGPAAIVEEARAEARRRRHARSSMRTGVSLSRRRGVAADQFLYTTELFRPGIELSFKGAIRGPISLAQAALVVAGLRFIPALGGGKSGGLGWFRLAATVYQPEGAGWRAVSETALQEAAKQWQ